MTVGFGVSPNLLTHEIYRGARGLCGMMSTYRRWGISPRPENFAGLQKQTGSSCLEGFYHLINGGDNLIVEWVTCESHRIAIDKFKKYGLFIELLDTEILHGGKQKIILLTK